MEAEEKLNGLTQSYNELSIKKQRSEEEGKALSKQLSECGEELAKKESALTGL
jgi:chromosome segregation ATPase